MIYLLVAILIFVFFNFCVSITTYQILAGKQQPKGYKPTPPAGPFTVPLIVPRKKQIH